MRDSLQGLRTVLCLAVVVMVSSTAARAGTCSFDAANPFSQITLGAALSDPECNVIEIPPAPMT